MKKQDSVNRRTFISTAGLAVAGAAAIAKPASAKSKLTIRRKAEIPYKPDVLVVGGGPAGIGAALGAAGSGANTLLIEHHAFFGGVAAWCLGMPINQMRPGNQARSKYHELILEKLRAYGDQAVRVGEHQLWCNVDYLKVAILDALDQFGCKYLVHTRAIDAVVKRNRIAGVVVATKRGPAVIEAKAVVDCTGDADVAYYAGAETMKELGNLSPQTLCLNLTNITREQLRKANMGEIARKA
ncbi:MAG: FAD-dependent oxidoreductase, partial [Planctomycetota bacterium]